MRKEALAENRMAAPVSPAKKPQTKDPHVNGDALHEKHEFSGDLNLKIPKSLHRKLWESAILEGVSLEQYIIYKLTQ